LSTSVLVDHQHGSVRFSSGVVNAHDNHAVQIQIDSDASAYSVVKKENGNNTTDTYTKLTEDENKDQNDDTAVEDTTDEDDQDSDTSGGIHANRDVTIDIRELNEVHDANVIGGHDGYGVYDNVEMCIDADCDRKGDSYTNVNIFRAMSVEETHRADAFTTSAPPPRRAMSEIVKGKSPVPQPRLSLRKRSFDPYDYPPKRDYSVTVGDRDRYQYNVEEEGDSDVISQVSDDMEDVSDNEHSENESDMQS